MSADAPAPADATLALLREMRAEAAAFRAEMSEFREETSTRLDGLTHIVTMMAAHQHRLDERLEALEEPAPTGSD